MACRAEARITILTIHRVSELKFVAVGDAALASCGTKVSIHDGRIPLDGRIS